MYIILYCMLHYYKFIYCILIDHYEIKARHEKQFLFKIQAHKDMNEILNQFHLHGTGRKDLFKFSMPLSSKYYLTLLFRI